jgi:hypothetical protein
MLAVIQDHRTETEIQALAAGSTSRLSRRIDQAHGETG